MTKPLPFTQVGLKRAIAAVHACGLRVKGIAPDGTVLVEDGINAPGVVPAAGASAQDAEPSDEWGGAEA